MAVTIPLGNFGNVMPQAQAGRVLDTGAGQVAQAVGNLAQVGQQYAIKEQKSQDEKDQYQFNIEASKYGAEYQDEPYRVCRRVNILRDYPDDKIKICP